MLLSGVVVLHHYKLTRFSNLSESDYEEKLVLHHYKLTRFSNYKINAPKVVEVLHHYKLTRFSNYLRNALHRLIGFTPLQTYKVLKRAISPYAGVYGFTPLQTYKVLKPQMRSSPNRTYRSICVSHLVMYKTHVFIY